MNTMAASDAGGPPLLALGILPSKYHANHAADAMSHRRAARRTWLASPPAGVVWRFVLAPVAARRRQRRRLESTSDDVIELPTPLRSSCGCAELVHAWFSHALAHWPGVAYLGKTEDDIMVSLPAVLFDVRRLASVNSAHAAVWYGLMAWTGNGGVSHPRVGCWAGMFEDDPTLSAKGVRGTLGKERQCPDGARPVAPAPTHEIDIRSASLARLMVTEQCAYPTAWLKAMNEGSRRCPNDCAAVQGLWLRKCAGSVDNVTLAHATWSKVHSNSYDGGWRPFAPPSANLTAVLDMNLSDKKLRQLANEQGAMAPWRRAADAMLGAQSSAFPPLLYAYRPARADGEARLLTALNPSVAAHHYATCRWGGCHPSRGEVAVEWAGWRESAPWEYASAQALGLR